VSVLGVFSDEELLLQLVLKKVSSEMKVIALTSFMVKVWKLNVRK